MYNDNDKFSNSVINYNITEEIIDIANNDINSIDSNINLSDNLKIMLQCIYWKKD